jgi:hypothetical protein
MGFSFSRLQASCLLPAGLLFFSLASSQPIIFQTPLSPRIANYDIGVRYEPSEHTLDGHETLSWHNASADIIHNLEMHLYLNGFRNDRSTFLRESGVGNRGGSLEKGGWGFSEIRSMRLSTGEDLTHAFRFIHPDDDNADDRTVIDLPLPRSLSPGDSVKLYIDFFAKLPQPPIARSGAKEEYALVGQWFPKMGVYLDGAWNCHQYHATSEFFADFGVYNVRMTVPEKNIVGATGLEVQAVKNHDGTVTHWYHAEDVHDFAWTTSPEFVEFTGKCENVDIRVLMQPDHRDQGPRHVAAAATAIKYFHDWYGVYPFPNLTVVDPRRGAGGSGGMEYPTLVTAGTVYGLPEGIREVENVIVHEFGHNYWYHLLASNEFEESWMDEGINTYTEMQIMRDAYGPEGEMINFCGVTLDGIAYNRLGYITLAAYDPTLRFAWQYYSEGSYGINSYSKPGLLLTTLQNYVGADMMRKVMRTYVDRWRFRHPKTKDFIAVVNDVTGTNFDWYFDQAIYSNAVLDYSVDKLEVTEVRKGKGYDFNLSTADPKLNGDSASSGRSDSVQQYLSEVALRRLGAFTFPVTVEIVFTGGEKLRVQWDGKELWKKYRYLRSEKVISATVDPDHLIPLDVNFTNNSKTLASQQLGITKTAVRILFWIQSILDQPELLNMINFLNGFF